MIQTWQITPTEVIKLGMSASSLDALTRRLPDPDGYYSTFRTYDGGRRVLGLAAHLQRLFEPVSTAEVSATLLRQHLRALLEPYRSSEARVRAIMTKQGQVYVAIEPLKLLPRAIYEKGVRVETIELQREHPSLKSTTFISRSVSERKHIAQQGIFEALLVKKGRILEGMTSNFFHVRQVANLPYISTARSDILLGVTRKTVIDIAREQGLRVNYQSLKRDQLTAIDEAFITSSSRGIVPVIQIDNAAIGQGRPGPITKQLSAAYDAYVIERAERI